MSLSIRHMKFTMQRREHAQARSDAAWFASLPESEKETQHYWFILRKAKRGNRWIYHTQFAGTKARTAEFWRKHFLGRKEFRLKHILKY